MGYIAIFIFIDLDKACSDKNNLEELIKYCNMLNKSSDIPYFLIGTNPDFEYFSCCHCPKYKNRNTSNYIVKAFTYFSVNEFKGNSKIFDFLNKDGRTYNNAVNYLKTLNSYFRHDFKIEKKELDITIKLMKKYVLVDQNQLSVNHSNIWEFFDIVL